MKAASVRRIGTAVLSLVSTGAYGETKTAIANVPAAEKLCLTADNRLFVGGREGLYVIAPGCTTPEKVPVALSPSATPSTTTICLFSGLVQVDNYLYAICSVMSNSNARNYVVAMDLTRNDGMRAIYASADCVFYNGLTADGAGHLYLSMFPGIGVGRIDKLTLSSPTTVASRHAWLTTAGQPKSLRIHANTLYFSENPPIYATAASYLRKVKMSVKGTAADVITLHKTATRTVMDDFILVDDGVVLATSSAHDVPASDDNKLLHMSESGEVLHQSSLPFYLPSALALKAESRSTRLYVVERGNSGSIGAAVLCEFRHGWNLRSRS